MSGTARDWAPGALVAEGIEPAQELSLEAGQPHDFAQADTANREDLAADLARPAPAPAGPADVTSEVSRRDVAAAKDAIADALQGGEPEFQDMSRIAGTARKTAPQDLRRANACHLNKALSAGSGLPCHVLSYEPDFEGVGRMAVALGDIETAAHVAVLVPGMGSDPSNFDRLVRRARTVHDECRSVAPGAKVAIIAWQGYKAPRDIFKGKGDASDDKYAKDGSRLLNIDLAHWRALWKNSTARKSAGLPQQPQITVNGFSYGSVVAGYALMRRTQPGGVTDTVKGAYAGLNREVVRQVLSLFPLTAGAKKGMQGGTWTEAVTEGAMKALPIAELATDPTLVSAAAYVYRPVKATVMRSVNQARAAYKSEPLGGGEADYLVLFGSPGTGRRAQHLNIPATRIFAAAHKLDPVSKSNFFSIDPTHYRYDPTGKVTRLKTEYTPDPALNWEKNRERAHTSYYDPATETQPARESLTNLARIVTGNRHKVTPYKKRAGLILEGHKSLLARPFTNPPTNTPLPRPAKQTGEEKRGTEQAVRSRQRRNVINTFGSVTELDFDGWKMLVERGIDWNTRPDRGVAYQTIIEALVPGAGDLAGVARATNETDRIWYTTRLVSLPVMLAYPHVGLLFAVADFVKGKAEAFVSTLAAKDAARRQFQENAVRQIDQTLDRARRLMTDEYAATLADEGGAGLHGKRYRREILKIAILAFQAADAQAAGFEKAWETHPSNQGFAVDKSMLNLKYTKDQIKPNIDAMLYRFLNAGSVGIDSRGPKMWGRIVKEGSALSGGAVTYLPREAGGRTFLHVTPTGQAHLVTMKDWFSTTQGVTICEEKRELNSHLTQQFSTGSPVWTRSSNSDQKGPHALAFSDSGVLYALFRGEIIGGGVAYYLRAFEDYTRSNLGPKEVALPNDFPLPANGLTEIRGMYFDPNRKGILVIEYGGATQYCQLDIGAYEKQSDEYKAWEGKGVSARNDWLKLVGSRPKLSGYIASKMGKAPARPKVEVTANQDNDTAAIIHQAFSNELGKVAAKASRDRVAQGAFGDVLVGGSVDGKRWAGRYGEKRVLQTDFGTEPIIGSAAANYTPNYRETVDAFEVDDLTAVFQASTKNPRMFSLRRNFGSTSTRIIGAIEGRPDAYIISVVSGGGTDITVSNDNITSYTLSWSGNKSMIALKRDGKIRIIVPGGASENVSEATPEPSGVYRLPKPMSFKEIAASQLGDGTRWREIHGLNEWIFGPMKRNDTKDKLIPRGVDIRLPVQ
ncbi:MULTISPECIES: alpha/beta hydrolase [unclassified Streptomyces]|uniref:alpha/beta hydrolase n=1 Tax=unclassified Streptomyces TaxID=2593676 RepID=UPI0037F2DE35